MTKKRLAFKYAVRRFLLSAAMLALIGLAIWFFAAKPQIDWPFLKKAPEPSPSLPEDALSATAQRFDGEPGASENVPEPPEAALKSSSAPQEPDSEPESPAGSEPSEDSREIDSEPDSSAPERENSAWALILVNRSNFLPEGYDGTITLENVVDPYRVDARIADPLKRMFADARNDGVTLTITSAYRSVEKQTELFTNKVEELIHSGRDTAAAQTTAATIVARPGTSEHHTGLAIDIITPSYTSLDEGFENTPAFKWLDKNAHQYGFVLRYPKNKQGVTGIIYEPWHYRFVGEGHAARMKSGNLCLEEYLESLRALRIKAASSDAQEENTSSLDEKEAPRGTAEENTSSMDETPA